MWWSVRIWRRWRVEEYLRTKAPHKHAILVLNEIDLVVGPIVGKSSVMNTLRGKKVAPVTSIPGETKIWQCITLTKRIYKCLLSSS